MSDENDNVVDLAAFRKQKELEEEEKARIQQEVDDEEEIQYMRYLQVLQLPAQDAAFLPLPLPFLFGKLRDQRRYRFHLTLKW